MNRRLLALAAIALAGVTLTGCSFSIGTPSGSKSSSSSQAPSDEPADDSTGSDGGSVDEFGFTADQRVMLDKMFIATAGQDFAAVAAVDADQAQSIAQQYLSGAESLCSLDPTTREAQSTHDGFISSFTSTSKLDEAAGQAVWDAIIEYCATTD
ncbi:MAG: hypothetical protein DI534_06330 [Leifsonia xyli]|nr:MAG: hypothetical protein DI534_06330 [Leifsonia xyli]